MITYNSPRKSNEWKPPSDATPIPPGTSYSRVFLREGKLFRQRFNWDKKQWGREEIIERG